MVFLISHVVSCFCTFVQTVLLPGVPHLSYLLTKSSLSLKIHFRWYFFQEAFFKWPNVFWEPPLYSSPYACSLHWWECPCGVGNSASCLRKYVLELARGWIRAPLFTSFVILGKSWTLSDISYSSMKWGDFTEQMWLLIRKLIQHMTYKKHSIYAGHDFTVGSTATSNTSTTINIKALIHHAKTIFLGICFSYWT